MIWLTSDLHLGHANILKYNDRPYESVDEMDDALVKGINERVGRDDQLWILGDVAMGRAKVGTVGCFLAQVSCREVHLILGNHDPRDRRDELLAAGFASVSDYEELFWWKDGVEGSKKRPVRVVLSHYPFASWNGSAHGASMLHGHIHSQGPAYNESQVAQGLRRYDVGVDANGYAPVLLDDVMAYTSRALGRYRANGESLADIEPAISPVTARLCR